MLGFQLRADSLGRYMITCCVRLQVRAGRDDDTLRLVRTGSGGWATMVVRAHIIYVIILFRLDGAINVFTRVYIGKARKQTK